MPCSCVSTAVIKEQENEKLRILVKKLEKRIQKYQEELIAVYDLSDHNETYFKVVNRKC